MRVDERGVGGHEHDVGIGDEVQPAACADAVDGDDRRKPDVVVEWRHPLQFVDPVRRRDPKSSVADPLEVHAHAEAAAGSGDHDRPSHGIGTDPGPDGGELGVHLVVERVQRVRTVERHHHDAVGLLELDLGHAVHPPSGLPAEGP